MTGDYTWAEDGALLAPQPSGEQLPSSAEGNLGWEKAGQAVVVGGRRDQTLLEPL